VAACWLCGGSEHDPSCALRLAPDYAKPQPRQRRNGGPDAEDWPPLMPQPRVQLPEVSDKRVRALQLRDSGLTWREVGAELGCSENHAWRLANGR
jgi:hypothetical protein